MERDVRRTEWLDSLRHDVKYASRMLWKNPGFTAVAVLCLTLGIGANSAIFSVINAVLFRPLPYPQADRLFVLWTDLPNFGHETASFPDFLDWRAQNQAFEDLSAAARSNLNLTAGGEPERILGALVTPNWFHVLGVPPALGRAFTKDEQGPGAPRVVILGDGLWRRRFAGAPSIVGQTIEINAKSYEVIGVAAPGFKDPEGCDVWLPLTVDPATSHRRGDFLHVVGRGKPGVTAKRAQDEMTAIAGRLAKTYPDTNANIGTAVVPMHEQIVGDARPALLALWTAVVFVLLIACANVASLLLARGASRGREIAMRAALGAGRGRIIRQLLTESVMLSLLSGGLGLLLALQAVKALVALQPGHLPRVEHIAIDRGVLVFSLAASLLTGILFGIFPALQVSRTDVQVALKEGGRGASDGGGGRRLRGLLVVVQTALAVILLIGAGLMVRSFMQLQRVDTGVRPDNLLTMRVSLTPARYPEDPQVLAFVDQLVTRLKSLPGVRAAGAMNALYFSEGGFPIESFDIEGNPPPPPGGDSPDAHLRSFTPGTHRMLGIRVLRGRGLTEQDGASDRLVVVVNEAMVKRHFGGRDPIGRRLAFGGDGDGRPRWREIVGVMADVRQLGPDAPPYPEIQMPTGQYVNRSYSVIVQTATAPLALASAVRAEVRALDPLQPVYAIQTVEQAMGERVARPRFMMLLFLVFAVAAFVLAAVGIYGLVSYSVAQRRQEVGVRVALGAQPGEILRMILGQGMTLALVGLGVGIVGALALTRLMASLLFEVPLTDPITYGAIAILLTIVALVASYVPARRAMRIEPMLALRE